jgi:uncharacterized SAM-binding protein YcdF (DUF218 family)
VIGAVTSALLVAVLFTPLPEVVSGWMSETAPVAPGEAIVVLGGGGVEPDGTLTTTSLRRTLRGLDLYRLGMAPLLVFSGPRAQASRAEADVRAEFARRCGVAPGSILTESRARTTHEEAERIGTLLRPRGIRTILLVVDAQGVRRARRAFEKVGFQVLPAPAEGVAGFSGSPEERAELARQVAIELLAWSYYRIAGYL